MENIIKETLTTLSDCEVKVIAEEFYNGVPKKKIMEQLLKKSNREFDNNEVSKGKFSFERYLVNELLNRLN